MAQNFSKISGNVVKHKAIPPLLKIFSHVLAGGPFSRTYFILDRPVKWKFISRWFQWGMYNQFTDSNKSLFSDTLQRVFTIKVKFILQNAKKFHFSAILKKKLLIEFYCNPSSHKYLCLHLRGTKKKKLGHAIIILLYSHIRMRVGHWG